MRYLSHRTTLLLSGARGERVKKRSVSLLAGTTPIDSNSTIFCSLLSTYAGGGEEANDHVDLEQHNAYTIASAERYSLFKMQYRHPDPGRN